MAKYDHVREVLGVVADRLEREKYDLQQENEKLREENETLKSQVSDLLHECHLRDKYPHSWQEHLEDEEIE